MATDKYSNIGKDGIVKEGIFNRFPILEPVTVGDNYWKNPRHSKLMIIGESNYFPDNVDSVFKDPVAWYQGEITKPLIPKEMEDNVSNYKAGYAPFDRLRDSMKAVLKTEFNYIYEEAIYYNYFLRPAIGGVSFRKYCKQIDREVAGVALCEILEIVAPNIVIFASKYAHDEFTKYIKSSKYNDTRIEFVYHPSNRFRRWESNPNSKQKFERLLKDYWLRNP